jgi:cation transporter-like permease
MTSIFSCSVQCHIHSGLRTRHPALQDLVERVEVGLCLQTVLFLGQFAGFVLARLDLLTGAPVRVHCAQETVVTGSLVALVEGRVAQRALLGPRL